MLRLAQEFHFFMVHKLLHYQPLYRWFHATHHKSYNPGPWSGLSMHPVTLTRRCTNFLRSVLQRRSQLRSELR